MVNIKKGARAYYADTDYRRDGTIEAYDKIGSMPVIPAPAAEDLGKVIKVGSNGYELASDAGAKLVVATVTADGQGNLSCDKTYAELFASITNGDIVELSYNYQTFVFSGIDYSGIHFVSARNDANGHNVITAWTISSANVLSFNIEGMNSELPSYSIADEGKFLGVNAQGQLGFFNQPGNIDDYIAGTIKGDLTYNGDEIPAYAMYQKDLITKLVANNVTKVGSRGMFKCTGITELNFPSLVSADRWAFQSCSNLVNFKAKQLSISTVDIFDNCTKIKKIDLQEDSVVGAWFSSTTNDLDTLILRQTSNIATLVTESVFSNTKFGVNKSGGFLYVPQSLIASYQSDTNWAKVLGHNTNNQILAIEGSIYE